MPRISRVTTTRLVMVPSALVIASSLLLVSAAMSRPESAAARSGQTTRVSITSTGGQANSASLRASISSHGRFVAFTSNASNLVSGDTNSLGDVFVWDRSSGTTQRVSINSSDGEANDDSSAGQGAISAHGRFVAFRSLASNLVPRDTNHVADAFVRDRASGTTRRVSVSSSGAQANSASDPPGVSADGSFVVFGSLASNLVPGDTNAFEDVFLWNRSTGTTSRVSVSSTGAQANSASGDAAISSDGRYVVFLSRATNLVSGDTNDYEDIFVWDRLTRSTHRVSLSSAGGQANGDSGSPLAISAHGRYVAFPSASSNLVVGGTNDWTGVFVRDRTTGTTILVSSDGGTQSSGGGGISDQPTISAHGRYVAFMSDEALVPGDTNGADDVFVWERSSGTTRLESVSTGGSQGDLASRYPAISAAGGYLAFESFATNLVPADTNGQTDVFMRQLP